MTDGRVTMRAGTLHGALDRLCGQGLGRVDGEKVENGRLRRYHALADSGAEASRVQTGRMESAARVARERLAPRPRFGGAA